MATTGKISKGTLSDTLFVDRSTATLEDLDISYSFLKAMLQREEELRISPDVQRIYDEANAQPNPPNPTDVYIEVSTRLQKQVATEFNLSEEFGVYLLRAAEQLVRHDPERVAEVRQISFYRRFNRLQDGTLQAGDTVPALPAPLIAVVSSEASKNADSSPVMKEADLHKDILSTTMNNKDEHEEGNDHQEKKQHTLIITGSYS